MKYQPQDTLPCISGRTRSYVYVLITADPVPTSVITGGVTGHTDMSPVQCVRIFTQVTIAWCQHGIITAVTTVCGYDSRQSSP